MLKTITIGKIISTFYYFGSEYLSYDNDFIIENSLYYVMTAPNTAVLHC